MSTTSFLKFSEVPTTKLQLKKAIEKGKIIVFEKDMNWEKEYRKLDSTNNILNLWSGFRFSPKFQAETNEATACLGTSFFYKFKSAN